MKNSNQSIWIIRIYQYQKMGNQTPKRDQLQKTRQHKTRVVIQMRNQQIIIHSALKMKLRLNDVEVFPHGLDGLKIWQAGIVLARYAVLNCQAFKHKQVLELGSGVGIAGITIKKWTQSKSVEMTDYHPQVVQTIKDNLLKNNQKVESFIFDWRERDKLIKTYDLIVGSDIVYFGCPVRDLYLVFQEKLRPGGKGIIIIPERKNYAQLFVKEVNKDFFDIEWQDIKDETYFQPPLQDEEKAKFQYSLLWQIPFKALIITKKQSKTKF